MLHVVERRAHRLVTPAILHELREQLEQDERLASNDDIRRLPDAEQQVLAFFQSAWEAGHGAGGWDRVMDLRGEAVAG